jgi:hypothetical protein
MLVDPNALKRSGRRMHPASVLQRVQDFTGPAIAKERHGHAQRGNTEHDGVNDAV